MKTRNGGTIRINPCASLRQKYGVDVKVTVGDVLALACLSPSQALMLAARLVRAAAKVKP